MNSDRGRRKEVEMKEQETKRILEKKKNQKEKKEGLDRKPKREKVNGRNRGVHQQTTLSLPLDRPTLKRLRIETQAIQVIFSKCVTFMAGASLKVTHIGDWFPSWVYFRRKVQPVIWQTSFFFSLFTGRILLGDSPTIQLLSYLIFFFSVISICCIILL